MKESKKQLWIYVAVVFALTWSFDFLILYPAVKADMSAYTLLAAVSMFFPALSMLLTRLITKEGFHDLLLRPRFRGNGGSYILAYAGPGVLVLLGAVVYFLLFPSQYDPTAGYLREIMAESGMPYEAQAVPIGTLLLLQVVQALALGGILNLIPSLGEEWGWRGYMMPRLLKTMKPLPALLTGGVIWGLWHAPLIALGHNYGTGYPGYPWVGIAAMCVFCVVFGILLTWVTEKTGSVIPAAVAHGAFNGIAGIGAYLTADGGNRFVGPLPTGIIGSLPLILAAVPTALWLIRRKPENEE